MPERPDLSEEFTKDFITNQSEIESNSKILTPDKIFSDPNLLKELYSKAKEWEQNPNQLNLGLIYFGRPYLPIDAKEILFYIGYKTGLLNHDYYHKQTIKYIITFVENPDKAADVLDEMLESSKVDKQTVEYLNRGLDLSNIIPEAPQLITEFNKFKYRLKGNIDSRSTEKVHDLGDDRETSPKTIEVLQNLFKDRTIIDLGAGEFANGAKLASQFNAKNYVAVEPYNTTDLYMSIADHGTELRDGHIEKHGNSETEYHPLEKIHIAKTDILTFLSKIPSHLENSVILISGIDDYILGVSHATNDYDNQAATHEREEYIKKTRELLTKILEDSKNTVCISYASILGPDNWDKLNYKYFRDPHPGIEIFTTADLKNEEN